MEFLDGVKGMDQDIFQPPFGQIQAPRSGDLPLVTCLPTVPPLYFTVHNRSLRSPGLPKFVQPSRCPRLLHTPGNVSHPPPQDTVFLISQELSLHSPNYSKGPAST